MASCGQLAPRRRSLRTSTSTAMVAALRATASPSSRVRSRSVRRRRGLLVGAAGVAGVGGTASRGAGRGGRGGWASGRQTPAPISGSASAPRAVWDRRATAARWRRARARASSPRRLMTFFAAAAGGLQEPAALTTWVVAGLESQRSHVIDTRRCRLARCAREARPRCGWSAWLESRSRVSCPSGGRGCPRARRGGRGVACGGAKADIASATARSRSTAACW